VKKRSSVTIFQEVANRLVFGQFDENGYALTQDGVVESGDFMQIRTGPCNLPEKIAGSGVVEQVNLALRHRKAAGVHHVSLQTKR